METKNKLVLMDVLGYQFESEELLTLALTHRSRQKNQKIKTPDTVVNYERLEFLGDAALGLVMAKYLYNSYPKKQEGQLTRMRASLVRQETLVLVANSFNLGDYLILGAGELKAGGRKRDSILADVVEAVIGAIYLDSGDINTIETLILKWFEEPLNHVNSVGAVEKLKDNKSLLQEKLQAEKLPLPLYQLIQVKGKAPKEVFTVSCEVINNKDNVLYKAEADGRSRRIAEQNAAKNILKKIADA